MKAGTFALVSYIIIGYAVTCDVLVDHNEAINITKRIIKCESKFDELMNELLSQNWAEEERPCLEQILTTIYNVKNLTLWANWIWDSMQLPVGQLYGSRYHLGNYDQCLRETVAGSHFPFRKQYCLADIVLQPDKKEVVFSNKINLNGPTEKYIYSVTKLKQRFNIMTWGVCTPQICKTKSVKSFIKALLKQSHLMNFRYTPEITLDKCEVAQDAKEQTDAIYGVLFIILSTIVPACICTLYNSTRSEANSQSNANRIIQCFCLKRNFKDLLDRHKNDIEILHGMRFISCSIIVYAHVIIMFLIVSSTGNGLDFEEDLHYSGLLKLSSVIVVDTFFLMSGLLLIRSIKGKITLGGLGKVIIKRYFRLIWWYMAGLLLVFFISPRTSCGPLCSKFAEIERDACMKTWWLGMLMVGNYIDTSNLCLLHTWYIFCDFHLTVATVLMCWVYQRQRRTGIICFTILAILSVILPGLDAYYGPEVDEYPLNFELLKELRDSHSSSPIITSYIRSHLRASPFFMGLMMGYIMTIYEPKSLRRTITKKHLTTAILVFVAVATFFLIACSYMDSVFRNAVVMAIHRPIWGAFICTVIVICEYGTFPIVKDFLSWSGFVPLSKLTYGIYMIHSTTIMYNMITTRSPLYYNSYIVMEKFLGNMALACFISLYFLLFVEAPLNNLVNLLLNNSGNAEEKVKDKKYN
ncbi:unnamed protein product [Parnassius apollo]|uniref:(apollo) hypothetical protein n=1 Tax=Parnassius apollo TaxID=110799 RepID=A0A8S3Y3P3_PARAO|nr:unnamed protein product [Parnassius apollo]